MLYCEPVIPDMFWIIIGLMSVVAAALYALGKAMAKSDFEAMAKTEVRQLVISVAIGFGAIGLALSLCGISSVLLTYVKASVVNIPGQLDQFRLAEVYLNTLIDNVGRPTLIELQALSYISFFAPSLIRTSTGFNPLVTLRTFEAVIDIINGFIFAPIVASLSIQLITMSLVQVLAFSVVLPAGIVARAFVLTRDGGTFLIALAIGMYFLWPFLYVINYELSVRLWPELTLTPTAPTTAVQEFSSAGYFPTLQILDRAFNLFDFGSKLILQALILPLLNITIFIGFVRIFAEFLMSIR